MFLGLMVTISVLFAVHANRRKWVTNSRSHNHSPTVHATHLHVGDMICIVPSSDQLEADLANFRNNPDYSYRFSLLLTIPKVFKKFKRKRRHLHFLPESPLITPITGCLDYMNSMQKCGRQIMLTSDEFRYPREMDNFRCCKFKHRRGSCRVRNIPRHTLRLVQPTENNTMCNFVGYIEFWTAGCAYEPPPYG